MTSRVVVIGASGFGRETLDTLEAMIGSGSDLAVTGVVDDHPSETNLERLNRRGITYLGSIEQWISSGRRSHFVLGIGAPSIRKRLAEQLEALGYQAFTAIHPQAMIGSGCHLSPGVVVCAGAILSTNVSLGEHVHVNPGAIIGHDTEVASCVSINPGAVLSGEVQIGTQALIGASATVLQQLSIGPTSIIGAGSLVTRDVPQGVTVKGVPGRW